MKMSLKQLHALLGRRAFTETDPDRKAAMMALDAMIVTQFSDVKGRIDFDEPLEEEETDDPMNDFNYVGSRHHY
jgi:hypothetical protein